MSSGTEKPEKQAEKASLREMPDGFLEKMEDFYRKRAVAALRSMKSALEMQMGQEFDPELSYKLDGVQVALETLER